MKKLLIILLLSFIICKKDSSPSFFESTIDSIQCLLKSGKLFDSFSKIYESVKTKDIMKIFTVCYSVFMDLKKELNKCSEEKNKIQKFDEDENDDDIILGYPRCVLILSTFIGDDAFRWYEEGGYSLLSKNCFQQKGRQWYCYFIREQE